MVQLVFYHRNINLKKFENSLVLNLCTRNVIDEEHIGIDHKITFLKATVCENFKDNYVDKLSKFSVDLFNKAKNEQQKASILSYETFSRLVVSDSLLEKFWQLSALIHLQVSNKNPLVFVFIDELEFYIFIKKHYTFESKAKLSLSIRVQLFKRSFFHIIPIKVVYGLIKSIWSFLCTINTSKPPILDSFKIFVGNVFEGKRVNGHLYSEYFFGTHWQNESHTILLINRGDRKPNSSLPHNRISIKESFLGIRDILRCFSIAIKQFYNPIRLQHSDLFDALITYNLRINSTNSSFYFALTNYFIFKKIRKIIGQKPGAIVIPHEGRVYEKLIQLVFKNHLNVKLIGYAHFPLSDKILNMRYSKLEESLTNNFKTYTFGLSNLDFLISKFNWPENKVFLGPHLKNSQSRDNIITDKEPAKKGNLLLLLGMEIFPNERILNTLFHSLRSVKKNVKVFVRGHPSIKNLNSITSLCRTLGFTYSIEGSLSDQVKASSIILYGDTGAPVDSLYYNKPLVYINDDLCIDSDRLTDLGDKHFRALSINELSVILNSLLESNYEIDYSSNIHRFVSNIDPSTFKFD